jgi:hypothetical protein
MPAHYRRGAPALAKRKKRMVLEKVYGTEAEIGGGGKVSWKGNRGALWGAEGVGGEEETIKGATCREFKTSGGRATQEGG